MAYDLFLSYASADRKWAKRLHDDLISRAPDLKTFWDRESLPPGPAWEPALYEALADSRFLAVIWSDAANPPSWVGPELERFLASAQQNLPGSPRDRVFYIPLQGKRANLESAQGFAEFRNLGAYAAGIESVDNNPDVASEWTRMVRQIVARVAEGTPAEPLPVAVLAPTEAEFARAVAGMEDMPSLAQALAQLALDGGALSAHYGATALDWKPFGTADSAREVLAKMVDDINGKKGGRRIRVDLVDITEFNPWTQTKEIGQRVQLLSSRLSLILIDPFTLYHPRTRRYFELLHPCFSSSKSVVVFVSPDGSPGPDVLGEQVIQTLSSPVLDAYFDPPVPRTEFAQCAVNVRYPYEIRRLVQVGLGMISPVAKAAAATPEFINNRG